MPDPLYRADRSIALVGLMGSGKSTIGRRLAKRLNMAFVDADDEIERAAGLSIAEIFDRFGESHFRDGERRVIARLAAGTPRVIATGGGAFVDPATRTLLLESCVAIWLDATIDTLAERVGRRDHRPLLRDRDAHEVLANLAEIRNPFYAQAHISVQSAASPHERVVDQIVEALIARRS
jgi:shikimate kinase